MKLAKLRTQKNICERKIKRKKVYSYLAESDVNRLKDISRKYGFKSTYQVIQYLTHCFLRVADPDNDEQIECVPEEIEQMFTPLEEYENSQFRKQKRSQKTPDDL